MSAKEPRIYSVSELNHLAQELLESHFSNVWLEGEVSNYRGVASSGHCYFSLKDENAQVDVVAFRGVMSTLRFKLEDGLKILICGRVSLYLQRGRFQIIAASVEPRGLGALQLAFEQLKKKLEAEGLFAPERKKPIPAFPQRIGLVTSPTGAAVQDILTVIDRRFANVEILIYPVKVQGEGAKEEIAEGIRYLNENHADLDVLLVGRGGGSIEDLWAFNEEAVARAIAASRIPIVSCVGHEIDFTIADFVADLRAPTPSAAAELVVKNKKELAAALDQNLARLVQNVQSSLNFAWERLKGMARSPAFSRPEKIFEGQTQTLDLLASKISLLSPQSVLLEREKFLKAQLEKISGAVSRKLEQSLDALKVPAGQLEALSPLAVLSRGYSIAWSLPEERILKSALQVSPGDGIRIKLHQGEIKATVQETPIGEQNDHQERKLGIKNR